MNESINRKMDERPEVFCCVTSCLCPFLLDKINALKLISYSGRFYAPGFFLIIECFLLFGGSWVLASGQ